jgi:Raf kinase inhibitor-like YbhB/YbcL family protein
MKLKAAALGLLLAALVNGPALAGEFAVTSPSLSDGATIGNKHVFAGFGCTGDNRSPALSWTGAPADAKSFAVTVYDPDAPTGSGWWHWVLFDLPASTTELPTGAGTGPDFKGLPAGALHARNDYNSKDYGGAAPPPGAPHRYVFTVHALGVDKLGIDSDVSPAVVGFNLTSNTLARGHIIATYGL